MIEKQRLLICVKLPEQSWPEGFSRSKKITFSLPQKVRNNRFNRLYRKLTVATCLHITSHRSHKFISNFISTWLRGRMGRSFGQDNTLFTDSLALLNNHHPLTATYASRKVTLSLSKPSLLHSQIKPATSLSCSAVYRSEKSALMFYV